MPSGVDALLDVLLGGPRVQLGEGDAQAAFENRLVEVVPFGEAGNFRVTGNVVPAHRLQLLAEGKFDFVQFSFFSAHVWSGLVSMVDKLGSDGLGNVDSFVAGEEIVHQSGFEFFQLGVIESLRENTSI